MTILDSFQIEADVYHSLTIGVELCHNSSYLNTIGDGQPLFVRVNVTYIIYPVKGILRWTGRDDHLWPCDRWCLCILCVGPPKYAKIQWSQWVFDNFRRKLLFVLRLPVLRHIHALFSFIFTFCDHEPRLGVKYTGNIPVLSWNRNCEWWY